MKKNEKKTEVKTRKYDFRHLDEEVAIGVHTDSDLSKTIAQWLYQNTSELAIVELARELFHKGVIALDERTRAVLEQAVKDSTLRWSVKEAVGKLLSEKVS